MCSSCLRICQAVRLSDHTFTHSTIMQYNIAYLKVLKCFLKKKVLTALFCEYMFKICMFKSMFKSKRKKNRGKRMHLKSGTLGKKI